MLYPLSYAGADRVRRIVDFDCPSRPSKSTPTYSDRRESRSLAAANHSIKTSFGLLASLPDRLVAGGGRGRARRSRTPLAPAIGSRASSSQPSRTSRRIPFPSAPRTSARSPVRSSVVKARPDGIQPDDPKPFILKVIQESAEVLHPVDRDPLDRPGRAPGDGLGERGRPPLRNHHRRPRAPPPPGGPPRGSGGPGPRPGAGETGPLPARQGRLLLAGTPGRRPGRPPPGARAGGPVQGLPGPVADRRRRSSGRAP